MHLVLSRCLTGAWLLLAGCSAAPALRPDHGSYSTTGATTGAGAGVAAGGATSIPDRYPFPRARHLVVAARPADYSCVRSWVEETLRSRGIRIAAGGEAPQDALTLAVSIEALQGPGASWAPFSAAMNITSAHHRTDIDITIREPGAGAALWRARTRERAVLSCADADLKTHVQRLLEPIQ
jgi:hypothetical protein